MRSAGILLPIFSLPSPYGIGTLGQAARDFVQFLAQSGQTYWQVLPVGPTGYGDSPYQSFSSFAGNPYFIDLDDLARDGLLTQEEYAHLSWGDDPARVDYGLLYSTRFSVLGTACSRLLAQPPQDYLDFVEENTFWLEDYALFMTLKGIHKGKPWYQWPQEEVRRTPQALAFIRSRHREELDFWLGVQYLFYHQWQALKELANSLGVSIIGDLPIYVSPDSADVWADPDQFQLDDALTPTEVAGCPPDAFTADGQLWGNPLFRWDRMAQDGFSWWLRRISFQFSIYDMLRIDHFRGFDEYYAIPYGEPTARNGRWRPGPGLAFFQAVEEALGPRPIIAEDLGFLTDSVRQLLQDTGYPGMKVLEFAFDSREPASDYLPHRYPRNCVVYPGTHDNDTALGWFGSLSPQDALYAQDYLGLSLRQQPGWALARAAWSSVADLAVIPIQDLLGLDGSARINTPSTVGTNWVWRLTPGQIPPSLAPRLFREAALFERLPSPKE